MAINVPPWPFFHVLTHDWLRTAGVEDEKPGAKDDHDGSKLSTQGDFDMPCWVG